MLFVKFVEEGIEFDEEFISEKDPSILHFMIASGKSAVHWMPGLSCALLASNTTAGAGMPQGMISRPNSCGMTL